MGRARKAAITFMAVFFTAMNLYRVEMAVPVADMANDPLDLAYRAYSLRHTVILCACVIGFMALWLTGYTNRLIRSLLLVNMGVFLIIIIKCLWLTPDRHSFSDRTMLGAIFILSFYYLIYNFLPKISGSLKTNTTETKWQDRKKRRHG